MKKLLLIASITSIACISCNNQQTADKTTNSDSSQIKNPPDNDQKDQPGTITIVGNWKPVEANLKNLDESDKAVLLDQTTIEFTSNGNYLTSQSGDTKTGSYTYDPVSNKMIVTEGSNNDRSRTFTITWEGELISMTNDEGTVKMRRITGMTNNQETTTSNTHSSALVGKWKPVDAGLGNMDEKEKAQFMEELVLEFTGDGKYIAIERGRKQEATYTFNQATGSLIITQTRSGMTSTDHFSISWEGDKMIMTNKEGWVKFGKQ